MNRITSESVADLFFQLDWHSADAAHTECHAGRKVNFWRDLLPARLRTELMNKEPGDQVSLDFGPGELVPAAHAGPLTLAGNQFDPLRVAQEPMTPRLGRFYPKGLLKDVTGIFRANREPFRCVGLLNGHLDADFDHPLARKPLRMRVTVGTVSAKSEERGGTMRDWAGIVTQGAGMQARWQEQPTDFFSDRPFARLDEADDGQFYAQPRLVHHLDDTAREMVRALYARLLNNDMQVLDLMASWHSHLPDGVHWGGVTGLGLNARELSVNPVLSERLVHDLNADPRLPLPDSRFDAVICTVSVEYLINPLAVFREVARVLRPGGILAITFSNRWFAPKAIRIWSELHEFERMGLVFEYLQRAGGFTGVHTYSLQGLDRPPHDKYYAGNPLSDPLYAVWASRA
jgi:hypothetical protein